MTKSLLLRRCGALLAIGMLGLVAACSNSDKSDPPAELVKFKATAKVQRIWSAGVSGGASKLRLGLGVALEGDVVYAAGHKGDVAAWNVNTGKRLWKTETKLPLTGGPGVGGGIVVAGASHGHFVALDAATGKERWRGYITSEILAAPAVNDKYVLLHTVDGRLTAYRTTDGSQLWSAEVLAPRLALRGLSVPALDGEFGVCGFDTGRMMAVSMNNGTTLWDVQVAPPSGRSELERLVDIDAAVKIVDNDIYAVTYQGRVARVDRDTGQLQWTRDISSYSGLATDEDGLYVTSAEGSVVKIGRRTGIEMWKTDQLSHRRLSPPAVVGPYLVVADLDGYVHFLDTASGEFVARVKSSGGRVTAAPVVSGNTVVMIDNNGDLTALRVSTPGT
jgi:outer membrane protein assembly factor BamB